MSENSDFSFWDLEVSFFSLIYVIFKWNIFGFWADKIEIF